MDHLSNSLPQRLVTAFGKCKARIHLRNISSEITSNKQTTNDPKREEKNVIEAGWVNQEQCVKGCLLVQVPVPDVETFGDVSSLQRVVLSCVVLRELS